MDNLDLDFSWFNLDDYARFENMTTREWACEICIREELYELMLSGSIKAESKSVQEYIDRLRGKIVPSLAERGAGEHYNKSIAESIATEAKITASIRPVHFFDLWQIRWFFKDIVKKYWFACKRIQQLDKDKDANIAFTDIDDVIRTEGRALLHINLRSSDEQIKADFAKWLKYAREKNEEQLPKKSFSHKNFNKWQKNKYVPFIDLFLISLIQKKKITNHKIASMIFPDEYEVDRVEKVIW